MYEYNTCCIGSTYELITDMTNTAKKITPQTFFKHIPRKEVYNMLKYNRSFPIEKDYHVSYYKGIYNNIPCYYLCHSLIEYIWTKL